MFLIGLLCPPLSLHTVCPVILQLRSVHVLLPLLSSRVVSSWQVLTLIVSEFVLLEMPQRFWLWYSVIVPVLLLMRYPTYAKRKWQFFYLDFCYYVQVILSAGIWQRAGPLPPSGTYPEFLPSYCLVGCSSWVSTE